MLDLLPLGTRIIVKRKETPEKEIKQHGSLYIPASARERRREELQTTEGTVLAIGSNCEIVKPGDEVFFGRYSGDEIKRNGEKFILMDKDDVLAKVIKDG